MSTPNTKRYAFNWGKHEHQIRTVQIHLENTAYALLQGDAEYLGYETYKMFTAKPRAEQDRIIGYTERLAKRVSEVFDIAYASARRGDRGEGSVVTYVDGKTLNALRHIVNDYQALTTATSILNYARN